MVVEEQLVGTITSDAVERTCVLIPSPVRLQNGSVAVFSPVALTDDVKAKLASMGEVRYIAATDMEVNSH